MWKILFKFVNGKFQTDFYDTKYKGYYHLINSCYCL